MLHQVHDSCRQATLCTEPKYRRSCSFVKVSTSPAGVLSWVISHVPMFHITQPLDSIRYMVYNGYYKVMSNIPKIGHLTTPACPTSFLHLFASTVISGCRFRGQNRKFQGSDYDNGQLDDPNSKLQQPTRKKRSRI